MENSKSKTLSTDSSRSCLKCGVSVEANRATCRLGRGCKREKPPGERTGLVGKVFGQLTVIGSEPSNSKGKRMWKCSCSCGNESIISTCSLRTSHTTSCGCKKKMTLGDATRKHGLSRTPEHNAWLSMRRRCYDPKDKRYHTHGARGIRVCDRWLGVNGAKNFLNDMGRKPSSDYSLDRKDNDGNYDPKNCRWATAEQQGNNQRRNVFIEFDDERLTISQWERKLGFESDTLRNRINSNWDLARAMTEKPSPGRRPLHHPIGTCRFCSLRTPGLKKCKKGKGCQK